ncbi:MAG: biotin/lipoyl-binding protein [Clostridia bacterium]|nr:biotin/lipoyl-binding protein [Clostridia bacterium]
MRKFRVSVNGQLFDVEVQEMGAPVSFGPYGFQPQVIPGAFQAPQVTPPPPPAAAHTSPPPPAAGAAARGPEIVAPTPAPAKPAVPQRPAAAGGEVVPSPLPGTIMRLNVKVGDTVNTGDVLLVLESMKMENPIEAPCSGAVKELLISEGQTVNVGDPLVVIE